jgi:hypothetical protein
VEPQVNIADGKHGGDQEDAHHDHQPIRVTWSGDIEWQVVRRERMQLTVHLTLLEIQQR